MPITLNPLSLLIATLLLGLVAMPASAVPVCINHENPKELYVPPEDLALAFELYPSAHLGPCGDRANAAEPNLESTIFG